MTPDERIHRIGLYAQGPDRLESALRAVPEAAMKFRPAADKWSVHEIILHCADAETNSHMRLRYLLAEDDPLIVGYDQDRWAQRLDYPSRPLPAALATIRAVRANTVPLLESLTEDHWGRRGRHTEYSDPYTVETWLRLYSEHLEIHARQIERNLAAWNAAAR